MKLTTTLTWVLLLWASTTQAQKVLERGLAEVLSSKQSTNKYLVMHPAHPRGTLLRIRNPANRRYVDARVIGSMRPKYRVIIQVSQSVYEDLNARGKKFAVEILHAPIYEVKWKRPKKKVAKKIEPEPPAYKPIKPSNLNSRVVRTQTVFHTVKKGETLYRISRKYKVSVDKIKEWNNLADNNLKVGQDLVITVTK